MSSQPVQVRASVFVSLCVCVHGQIRLFLDCMGPQMPVLDSLRQTRGVTNDQTYLVKLVLKNELSLGAGNVEILDVCVRRPVRKGSGQLWERVVMTMPTST